MAWFGYVVQIYSKFIESHSVFVPYAAYLLYESEWNYLVIFIALHLSPCLNCSPSLIAEDDDEGIEGDLDTKEMDHILQVSRVNWRR